MAGSIISKPYGLLGVSVVVLLFSFGLVQAATITSYTLNGSEGDVSFNPAGGSVDITLTASEPVKFSTIAICGESDSTCSRTTAVKYFTQTNKFDTTVTKTWDGKTGGSSPTPAPDGRYFIKVTVATDSGASPAQLLEPHRIVLDSSLPVESDDESGEESGDDESNSNETASTTSTVSTTTTSSSSSGSSSHSSSAPLSSTNPAYTLEVSAGRSRVTTTGNHVFFDAVITRRDSGRQPQFFWTFGDGTSSPGQSVIHSYAFPGTYEVVLNATTGSDYAVSRTKVTVLPPTVTIREFNPKVGYIELQNTGSRESNIGEWKLLVDSHDFSLPQDTIISAGGTLLLPLSVVTGGESVVGGQVKLRDPQGTLLSTYDTSSSTITFASTTIETLAKQLAQMTQQVNELARVPGNPNLPIARVTTLPQNNFSQSGSIVSVGTTSEILATSSNINQTAGATFVVPKPAGWWGSIKNLFVR